ncbi:nicotinamide mononucleotide (NMN) deamidase PncC [Bradyrhizobium sp. LM6.10]
MKELVGIAEQVAAKLIARKQTIAVAESSTGGLIAASLLAVPGARPPTSSAVRWSTPATPGAC